MMPNMNFPRKPPKGEPRKTARQKESPEEVEKSKEDMAKQACKRMQG
jgi:hypothetical protein